MSEEYTTTETIGWGQRVSSSFKGIIGGIVVVCGSIFLLIWNEHNAVQSHRSINEAKKLCISAPSIEAVSTVNANKLIHVSGLVEPSSGSSPLVDTKFQVTPPKPSLKLEREVEMYQWTQSSSTKETKKTGGSVERETSYTYHKEWVSHVVDASGFQFTSGHENPTSMPFARNVWVVDGATMGAFDVPSQILDRMNWYQRLSPANYSVASLPPDTIGNRSVFVYQDEGYYFGNDPSYPRVGDTRVTFEYVPQQVVSIIAQQTGSSLSAYITSNKRSILLVEQGTVSAEEMFLHASKQAKLLAWLLRALGFFLLWMGFKAIVQPISVMGDVLPFLGNILQAGADVVTFLLALVISTLVIALSWLMFRPLLSIGCLAVVGGGSYCLWKRRRDQKQQEEAEVYVPSSGAEATEKTNLV